MAARYRGTGEHLVDLVGQALVLAALGLPVFPCGADKAPTCPTGFKAATRDPGAVVRLFARYPGVLIGIACGSRSGLAVLDVDVPKHPEAGLWLDANRARLPGRVFQTRSGGWHLYFRWVPGVVNCAGRPVVGIDARGEGGYVIWWGGLNLGRASPQGLAEWPEWLTQAIWPPPPPRQRMASRRRRVSSRGDPLERLLGWLAGKPEGQRNRAFYWACKRAVEHVEAGHLTRSEAEAALLAASVTTTPPMDRRGAARTIQSAFEGGNR